MTSSATLQSKRLRRRVITRLLQRLTLPFIHHLRLFTLRPRKHDLHITISTFLFLSKQKDCIKRQAREKHTVPNSPSRCSPAHRIPTLYQRPSRTKFPQWRTEPRLRMRQIPKLRRKSPRTAARARNRQPDNPNSSTHP